METLQYNNLKFQHIIDKINIILFVHYKEGCQYAIYGSKIKKKKNNSFPFCSLNVLFLSLSLKKKKANNHKTKQKDHL